MMVTLLADVHFWTVRDDIVIKDADIGAYKYQDKTSLNKDRVYFKQRRWYIESRGGSIHLKNTRPLRLRDSIRELEDFLLKEQIIYEGWKNSNVYQLLFQSGLLAILSIDSSAGDIKKVIIDKYLQGKLLSESVVDVCFSSRYMIFSYNDARATLVHIPRGSLVDFNSLRLGSQDPKVTTCDGIGPPGRRFERNLSININEDMVLFWWHSGENEVYPWSPLNKDQDRANLMVYSLNKSLLTLSCCCRTEMSPLSVKFSKNADNIILTVEQGFDKKGGVTVLSCIYEVSRGRIHRISVTSIPLEAPLTAHAHNPMETRLLLACNNGVLALHCESRGMTHVTKAGLIPSCITWLENGTLVFVSDDRGQVQCFDLALSLIRLQLLIEDSSPVRIVDFSDFFCHQPHLRKIDWSPIGYLKNLDLHEVPRTNKGVFREKKVHIPTIPLLFLHFSNGPLACLRFIIGHSYSRVSDKAELSPYLLINQYLKHNQCDEAINLLISLNWETKGKTALKGLCAIVTNLLKSKLTVIKESQIESALASFLVPPVALSLSIEDEFGPTVRALTRRFFYQVLRVGHIEKAYRLALDLKDHDCFLNVHHVARFQGNRQLASLAMQNAREIDSGSCWSSSCESFLGDSQSGSHNSASSLSESCSTCESDEEEIAEPIERVEEVRKKDFHIMDAIEEQSEENYNKSSESLVESVCSNHTLIRNEMTISKIQLHKSSTPPPPLPHRNDVGSSVQSSHVGKITINIKQDSRPDAVTTIHSKPTIKVKPLILPKPLSHSKPKMPLQSRIYIESSQISGINSSQIVENSHKNYVSEKKELLVSIENDTSVQHTTSIIPPKLVRDIYHSNVLREEFVGLEPIYSDRKELLRQYQQAIFHEVTTEEEDGGTVKVVHFGVV